MKVNRRQIAKFKKFAEAYWDLIQVERWTTHEYPEMIRNDPGSVEYVPVELLADEEDFLPLLIWLREISWSWTPTLELGRPKWDTESSIEPIEAFRHSFEVAWPYWEKVFKAKIDE